MPSLVGKGGIPISHRQSRAAALRPRPLLQAQKRQEAPESRASARAHRGPALVPPASTSPRLLLLLLLLLPVWFRLAGGRGGAWDGMVSLKVECATHTKEGYQSSSAIADHRVVVVVVARPHNRAQPNPNRWIDQSIHDDPSSSALAFRSAIFDGIDRSIDGMPPHCTLTQSQPTCNGRDRESARAMPRLFFAALAGASAGVCMGRQTHHNLNKTTHAQHTGRQAGEPAFVPAAAALLHSDHRSTQPMAAK